MSNDSSPNGAPNGSTGTQAVDSNQMDTLNGGVRVANTFAAIDGQTIIQPEDLPDKRPTAAPSDQPTNGSENPRSRGNSRSRGRSRSRERSRDRRNSRSRERSAGHGHRDESHGRRQEMDEWVYSCDYDHNMTSRRKRELDEILSPGPNPPSKGKNQQGHRSLQLMNPNMWL
jgi:hypothetical protein